jgi:predicted nuclease of restriction endonuclease-like (RecB) superfamily
LLYDRLIRSKNKEEILSLWCKGQELNNPEDAMKDPMVLEFLGLPESHQLVKSKIEGAIIQNL